MSKVISIEAKDVPPITEEERNELRDLANRPESEIDTSDAPEMPPEWWEGAVRGRFYRPIKVPVSIRLDADVLAWFKAQGEGYQTRLNDALRAEMMRSLK